MSEAQPLVVETPHAPSGALSGRAIAKALRDNALLAFPPEAFEEEVVYRSFFGRRQIILNRPAAIHHILVENPERYRRTPATMRMLRRACVRRRRFVPRYRLKSSTSLRIP